MKPPHIPKPIALNTSFSILSGSKSNEAEAYGTENPDNRIFQYPQRIEEQ